ncbi:MAG TPA: hypothetical protein VMU80_05055 [Bryobacteraceae bacterium]|nr:hypothetical protein [Bryobacteraceae bacterium]
MKQFITTALVMAMFAFSVVAQDWYHERDERFQGEGWRAHIFDNVRTDLEHVWSVYRASDRERVRLNKTREELYKMQTDLNQGRFDNGLLNDVIDSMRKSSNDDRLAARDREVIADDLIRLKDFQRNHNHWPH